LAARYNLVRLAAQHAPPVAIWLQTSHGDSLSYGSSEAFLANIRAPLSVNATVLRRAGHRISVWQAQLPAAVTWLGRSIQGFTPVTTG
jgi:hypothetical protein